MGLAVSYGRLDVAGQLVVVPRTRTEMLGLLNHHRELRCLVRGMQLRKSLASLQHESPIAPSN